MTPSAKGLSVIDFVPYFKRQGLWIALIVLPIVLNLFVFIGMITPAVKKLHKLQDTDVVVRLKPQLESLIYEGDELLARWQTKELQEQTSSAAFKEIQKLAQVHHVQIKEARVESSANREEAIGPFTKTAATFRVTGSFGKLAHWIQALESIPNFQVDSWSFAPAGGIDKANNIMLNISINMLLRSS